MKNFKEIAEEFGKKEVKLVCKDKIKEFREERAIAYNEEMDWRKSRVNDKWLFDMLIVDFTDKKEWCDKKIALWENRLKVLNGGKDRSKTFDLEAIKQVPIGLLLERPVSETKERAYYHCPLHSNDNTPSFTLYKDSNTWWCYGCSKGSSNIDLVMELYGVEFKKAIKIIQEL